MPELNLERLATVVAQKIKPFVDAAIHYGDSIRQLQSESRILEKEN